MVKDLLAEPTTPSEGRRAPGTKAPIRGAASCQLHGVEQYVFEEPPPHIALSQAMDACDEAAIWRQYHEAGDKDHFLRSLANLAGNFTTQQPHRNAASTLWHHALIAVPFILPPEHWPNAQPAETDHKAVSAVYLRLQEWLGYQQPVRVVTEAISYQTLCQWSPLVQLGCLQALAWRKSSCAMPPVRVPADIPEHWPQLAFLLGGVQRWNCLPRLADPCAAGQTEWQLRSRLAAQFGYIHHRPVSAGQVLAPLSFPEAILAGLNLWLRELVQRRLVSGWDIQFHIEDFTVLTLSSAEDAQLIVVPIRNHQVGAQGCEQLLRGLTDCLGLPAHHSPPNS